MVGELMAISLDELKHAQDVWQKLSQDEQDATIARIEARVKDAVRQCVTLVATQGFTRIPATVESITIKDGIKVQLTVSRIDANRHALTDSQGHATSIVLANIEQFTAAPHGHKGESDQLGLELGKIAGNDANKPDAEAA